MKRFSFLAVAFVALSAALFTSCKKEFKSTSAPLTGDLEKYTSLSATGDTLVGVRNSDGVDIIAPKAGVRFTVDKEYKSILIEVDNKTGNRTYYTKNGSPLSADSPLKTMQSIAGQNPYNELVYIGKNQKGVYYGVFDNTGEIFKTSDFTADPKTGYIGFVSEVGFVINKLDGTNCSIQEGDFFFVYQPFPNDPMIVRVDKKEAKIYKVNGDEFNSMPLAKWNKTIKNHETKQVGNATVVTLETELIP